MWDGWGSGATRGGEQGVGLYSVRTHPPAQPSMGGRQVPSLQRCLRTGSAWQAATQQACARICPLLPALRSLPHCTTLRVQLLRPVRPACPARTMKVASSFFMVLMSNVRTRHCWEQTWFGSTAGGHRGRGRDCRGRGRLQPGAGAAQSTVLQLSTPPPPAYTLASPFNHLLARRKTASNSSEFHKC